LGRLSSIVSFDENPPVLRCSGDEDRTTQSLRRTALSRALGSGEDLIVDLSQLSFADTSLMVDLAMVSRRLRRSGACMRLRDAEPQIQRLVELVGLHRLPGVMVEWPSLA
jgi:anti-anti-sigma factor